MIKELTCICCPMGCALRAEVDDSGNVISVSGNTCIRGENYAKSELTAPVRTVTTTAIASGGKPVPVKTKDPIPKEKIFDVVSAVKSANIELPVAMGDVLVADAAGTGVDIVATRTVR